MFGIIWSVMKGLFGSWLGNLFHKDDPTLATVAASNATNQAELTQTKAANEILTEAAAARAGADAARLSREDGPVNSVDARPDAAINLDPNGHYRD